MWDWFVKLIVDALQLFYSSLNNWGLAIILFTVAIKVVTWPLTSKQIKSSKVMQEMQPKMKAIQEKFKDDKEAQSRAMMQLYQESGTNPVMGCLPMLIQLPVWIGLYQAILKLAADNQLNEGFLFLPSLAFPNNDLGWLTNFSAYGQNWVYFILPILTVVTQIAISRLMTPSTASSQQNSDDPSVMMMKQMTTIMPLMFGVFALQFPAGLALYWVTNNILTGVQYAVVNRQGGQPAEGESPFNGQVIEHPVTPTRPKQRAALVEAAGQTVMETPVESTDYSKEPSKDGKSRRKRKKR